ncbi:hypothetical protein SAMN04487943_11144 [Gracilibacillus orientalis]|uniref:Uncharacterized protein n=1 Tax=Gracilibacillus orientalis TaxID=334253 RepID=A0A1I4PFG7_9BACI|nr:hypothetical protein SAMN04487943_11144 [Gracilibacillus orientalis]
MIFDSWICAVPWNSASAPWKSAAVPWNSPSAPWKSAAVPWNYSFFQGRERFFQGTKALKWSRPSPMRRSSICVPVPWKSAAVPWNYSFFQGTKALIGQDLRIREGLFLYPFTDPANKPRTKYFPNKI